MSYKPKTVLSSQQQQQVSLSQQEQPVNSLQVKVPQPESMDSLSQPAQ